MVEGIHRGLQSRLDGGHGTDDRLGELADPAVVHETDRHRVEEVAFLAPDLDGRHEPRFLQDAEVFHDPEPRHLRQVPAQLPERLAIALEEPIEQSLPIDIGKGPEDRRRRFGHARPTICDSMVTCQGGEEVSPLRLRAMIAACSSMGTGSVRSRARRAGVPGGGGAPMDVGASMSQFVTDFGSTSISTTPPGILLLWFVVIVVGLMLLKRVF